MGYAFCCVPPARLYIIGNSHHAVSMPLLQSHNTKLAAQVFCTSGEFLWSWHCRQNIAQPVRGPRMQLGISLRVTKPPLVPIHTFPT